MLRHIPLLAAVWLSAVPAHAQAKKKTIAEFHANWSDAPSVRYAAMDGESCRAELQARKITFVRVDEAPGVLAPVRIPKGLGGVVYRTALPAEQGLVSPWEVFDCRLVLALADFSTILARHDIDEVRIFSSWRPPGKRWPKDKLAKRHPGGLAVDVQSFRIKGETPRWLVVEGAFGGKIGHATCGPDAPAPSPAGNDAKLLRAIVCQAADDRIFTSILTPNHDRAHHNHFHFDLTAGVKWRIVR